jgi:hypothetical protein
MTNPTTESNALRTLVLAVVTWGAVAASLAASRVLEGQGLEAAVLVAAVLAAAAWAAYAMDDELRDAARATPAILLNGWALAFDLLAVIFIALAALSSARFGVALWKGIAPMGPLFAVPLAAAFHLAAFDGRRARTIRLSAPVKSPVRSPAGT